jgi:hypothetical protein
MSGTGSLLGESGCPGGNSSESVVDLIFLSHNRSVNISGWTGGSSLLSLGLTVGQAMAVTVVGNLLVSAAVVGTGMIGAKWCVSLVSFLPPVHLDNLSSSAAATGILVSLSTSDASGECGSHGSLSAVRSCFRVSARKLTN